MKLPAQRRARRIRQVLRSTGPSKEAAKVQSALAMGCSRGALTRQARVLDPRVPTSWEFSAFSQNGEDGIVDYLCSCLGSSNRYFVEIGASHGLENNTAYLAFAHRWSGLMVEADRGKVAWARTNLQPFGFGVEFLEHRVVPDRLDAVVDRMLERAPDVFSLDIDSVDYYVARQLMDLPDFRPKIVIVEYNSAFGPDRSVTVEYRDPFTRREHPSGLYYGVSVQGWRHFWERHGYRFVTVDRNGVNAVFADPAAMKPGSLEGLQPLRFAENVSQRRIHRSSWERQMEMIASMPLIEIP